jgi:gliding motility-associated-like protein
MRLRILTYFFALVLLVMGNAGFAQLNPPGNICATVVDDVTVQITWSEADGVPADGLYVIYRNNNDGNGWDDIGNVPTGDPLEWEDFVATPELGPVSYYIRTAGNDIASPPSDTVSTIFLDLTPAIGSLNSVAALEWNAPKSDTGNGAYNVYRQINGEPAETLIATLPPSQLSYNDTIFGLCIEEGEDPVDIKYYVSYEEGACEMSSQTSIDGFQDLLGPIPPQIETVLINPFTGNAEIYWYPGTEPDLFEYLVQSVITQSGNPDQFINLAFIPTGSDTEFTYEQASQTAPTNMVVIAFDDCGNDNSYSQIVSTMFTTTDYKSCDQFATVEWSPYEGWDEDVEKYIIHVDDGVTSYDITVEPEILQYDLEITPNMEYCIYVEALSNGDQRASTSNMSCFTTLYPQVVDYAYNSRATTISDRSIQVDLLQDPDGEGTTYALYRSEGGQSFQPVTTLNQSTDPIITYTDTDVDARNIIYDYKWIVYDGCGQELFETNTARNIVLQASSDKNELVNTLRWNRYQDWEEGVIEYEIYRRLGSEDEFTFLATVDPDGELIYQDDIESFLEDEGQFCYKIVALEEDNSFNSQTFSESNISCATQEPLMWIPNTIVINGHNDIFKPVAGFIDFESYEMEIFNKWGEKIFYTNNIDEGWDGTVNGNQVREDMYQYVIVYRDGSGQAYVDQGPLFVLIGNP